MSNSKVVRSTAWPSTVTWRVAGSSTTPFTSRRAAGGGARLVAAQNGAHAGHQFARIERLGQIIVRAEFQADDAVHVVGARGEHEHRHAALFAQPPEDFEAVHTGQHDVQDYQVEAAVQGAFQAAAAFMHALDREAFALEKLGQQGAQLGVVVDQQKSHGSECSMPAVRVAGKLWQGACRCYNRDGRQRRGEAFVRMRTIGWLMSFALWGTVTQTINFDSAKPGSVPRGMDGHAQCRQGSAVGDSEGPQRAQSALRASRRSPNTRPAMRAATGARSPS